MFWFCKKYRFRTDRYSNYVPYLCSKWQKHEFCDRSELKDFYLGHRWLSRATFLEPRIFISHGISRGSKLGSIKFWTYIFPNEYLEKLSIQRVFAPCRALFQNTARSNFYPMSCYGSKIGRHERKRLFCHVLKSDRSNNPNNSKLRNANYHKFHV